MRVQSVLIPVKKFSLKEATDWLLEHKYRLRKVDVTDEYYRFRQSEPSRGSYHTKVLPNGVRLVFLEPDRAVPFF
jgi:hypothetical protein